MSGLRLTVTRGLAAPTELTLEGKDQFVLGRDPTCDLRLESERASRRHAVLQVTSEAVTLRDLGSSSGTAVNGRFVEQARLAAGDVVAIAGVELTLSGSPAAPGQAQPRERTLLDGLTALLTVTEAAPDDLMVGVLDQLLEAFGADRAAVFLPGKGRFRREVLRLHPRSVLREDEPISTRFVRRVADGDSAEMLSSADTEELREELHSVGGDLRSILAAPLPMDEGAGVLYLDSALDRRRFEARDGDLLVAFARAAGMALSREAARRRAASREALAAERRRRRMEGDELLGRSPALEGVRREVEQAAGTDVSVLVTGESGTGKELVARALHRGSPRSAEAFIAVNCAAIPHELLESELFGHEVGAFTGAASRRLGHFELADGGTLFLDEVGELPASAQAKLLRALQERTIQRVGGADPVPVDFRLVSATNVDLEARVAGGHFREDLYYRLAVFRIQVPTLRDRGDDVLLLAAHFVAEAARRFGREVTELDEAAREVLRRHSWPGNVRELRNAIEQAVVRETGERLGARALLPALGADAHAHLKPAEEDDEVEAAMQAYPSTFEEARRTFERQYLIHQLRAYGGNMKATAEGLGVSRRNLYTKCDELGIDYRSLRRE